MARSRHLVAALANPGFRRLLLVRLANQFGDGVFQASLAGTVLFNPDRQAGAADIAAGFAVLLLPYSLVGPFAGVLIDRWSRQRTLVVANVVRAGGLLLFAVGVAAGTAGLPFYAAALILISIGRFLLSVLSAGLPRVVAASELVTANALSTTAGTVVAASGGAGAVGLRALIGSANADYAAIAALAALPYLLAAGLAVGFARHALGPTATEQSRRESVADVARGLVAGARHLRERRPVLLGLSAIGVHRLGYGVTTVCTLLLYRNYFTDDGFFRSGIAGLSQVVAMIAVGGALAAVITPVAFRAVGAVRWPAALIACAAIVQLLLLAYTTPLVLVAALLLGLVAQGVKISVDTLVQQQVDDEFRGRVFALYDALFNVTLVVAAVLTATVLPEDGRSPVSVLVIAIGYALTAFGYLRLSGRVRAAVHS